MKACLTALCLVLPLTALAGEPVIHPVPAGKAFWSSANDDFTVRVRQPGGQWRDLYEYRVRVDNDQKRDASMVLFDMDGPVEVSVRKNNGDVRRVQVRPASAGVKAKLEGDTAFFTLSDPRKISVEFDGDRLSNLHLFAGKVRPTPPEGAVMFGPGIHLPPDGADRFRFASDTTICLAPGAILEGGIDLRDVQNVRIIGNGLITKAKDEGIALIRARNVEIDGPVMVNPGHYSVFCGQSTGVTIRDFKAFSMGSWTDGLDFMSCSDVRIDDIFMRNSDDNIAIYGGRWEHKGDAANYLVTNAILWADIAHPINIGLHGTKGAGETISNLTFRNIDILEHDEDDPEYQGAIAITNGDGNKVRDVLFEDIRVERIEEGMPFNFRVVFNDKYSHEPGGGIENVTLRNVRFLGTGTNRPVIAGHADGGGVRNVRIENVTLGDRKLKPSDIDVGMKVEDLVIR
ncbi:glycosyl hydrolase family 28 protein [Niveispirillum sp. KHB5.9]|uniref:glycosyl hydrolase family 28 protein n=1 Tax=Niveispirillum sp. KHB5.9 TaxID=3400269 RepID=UPI003A8B0A47